MSIVPQKLDLYDMYKDRCKTWIKEIQMIKTSIKQDNLSVFGNIDATLKHLQALKRSKKRILCPEYQKIHDTATTIGETIQQQLESLDHVLDDLKEKYIISVYLCEWDKEKSDVKL